MQDDRVLDTRKCDAVTGICAQSPDGMNALFNSNGEYYDAYVVRVIDGDTFECNIRCPLWTNGNEQPLCFKVRLSLANTPETSKAKSAEERAAGERATEYVRGLLEKKTVKICLCGIGNFGRPLVRVRCTKDDGSAIDDLDTHLIENGWAVPYKKH